MSSSSYQVPTNRLFVHDARSPFDVFPRVEESVDVIITSPPYWKLKDYGIPDQIGYGQPQEAYLADIQTVLAHCHEIAKQTGSLWLVADTYREDKEVQLLPLLLAERARRAGWRLRELIVWDKQHSGPWQARGQLRNAFELILFMTKSEEYKYYVDRIKVLDELSKWWVDFPERYNPKGKTPTNIWSIPLRPRGAWRKPSANDHYCSFPSLLVARIIELTTDPGDLVMDPFAGSGVVLAQAAAMGRQYLGFEINDHYVQTFERTVKAEIAAEWEELHQWRQRQSQAKLDFEQTIMRLRALKYARQVTRPFLQSVTEEQYVSIRAVVCVASIPQSYSRGHPFPVEVLVVVDGALDQFEKALAAAKLRATKPPLTQYGICADIGVVTCAELGGRSDLVSKTFYLYPRYKPREYTASDSLRNWLEKADLSGCTEDGKVPMLANVGVDVAWALE